MQFQFEEDVSRIASYMLEYRETIAVSESVTSGFLQAAFSIAQNASAFFQGGITTYNLGQKSRHLLVEPVHALLNNSVSEKVSSEMALGACRLFTSDWGIGITGYATTLPEKSIYDLFAHYSFAFRGQIVYAQKVKSKKMAQQDVQLFYVSIILKEFLQQLESAR